MEPTSKLAYHLALSDAPELIVRGTLEKAPLAEFLVRALDERLEGTLILQAPDSQKHALLFLRGAAAKAKLADTPVYLSEVLVELGIVERSLAISTQKRAQASGMHHGTVLFEEGHLDQTALFVALREQLRRQVLVLCDLPASTAFGLYKANYLANWGPVAEWRVKPLPLVWRALADHVPEERRALALERLGGHMLRVRFESPVSRYAMTREELSIVNMLRAKPQTLSELESCGIASSDQVRRVVCALFVSRQLEGSARQGQPVGHAEPPESPNSMPPPDIRAARASITAPRAPRLPGMDAPPPSTRTSVPVGGTAPPQSPPQVDESLAQTAFREAVMEWEANPPPTLYDMLGVPREADSAALQRAFFQLARQWHPDKLPAALVDLKPTVTRIFARMSEAHQILSDPKRRPEYDQKLKEAAPDEQGQVAAIIEAVASFQKAEVLLKKRDLHAALEEATRALEGDPTQADYLALHTWIRSQIGNGKLDEHIVDLGRAVDMQPNNVRALWYRGQLLKRAGREPLAMKDFRAILEVKPNHVDAKRELHVYDLRRKTDPKQTGFLNKLLKK